VVSQAHAGGNYSSEKQQSGNIVETAAAAGQFETLLAAAKAAGLVETLSGQGPLTVFAPTDEAFAALPEGTVDSLLKPENRDQLRAILTYHVVPASAMAADVVKMDKVTTANGQDLSIRVDGDSVMIGEARVVKADVKASNGVIHVIDKVLIPAT
jgi:uncharacterized surface protein with fasciclin (FAS1) repeats